MVGTHWGKSSHKIIGPADKISAIFANKEACAAGLTERVKKARADVKDSGAVSGRDVSKPIKSNISAQAVQTNMASPRAPSISEDSDQARFFLSYVIRSYLGSIVLHISSLNYILLHVI